MHNIRRSVETQEEQFGRKFLSSELTKNLHRWNDENEIILRYLRNSNRLRNELFNIKNIISVEFDLISELS